MNPFCLIAQVVANINLIRTDSWIPQENLMIGWPAAETNVKR